MRSDDRATEEALKPRPRRDRSKPRVVSPEVLAHESWP